MPKGPAAGAIFVYGDGANDMVSIADDEDGDTTMITRMLAAVNLSSLEIDMNDEAADC